MNEHIKRIEFRLIVAVILVNVLFVSLAIGHLVNSRAQHVEMAATNGRNLARLLDHIVADKVRLVADSVDRVVRELEREIMVEGRIDGQRINHLLEAEQVQLPEIDALRITDRSGLVILGKGAEQSPGTSWADRDFFHLHQDQPTRELIISEPVQGKLAGGWIVAFTRSYRAADGTFAGIVGAAIPIDRFAALMAMPDLGGHDTVALRSSRTGGLIARHPPLAGPTGEPGNTVASAEYKAALASNEPIATYHAVQTVDDVERTYFYHRLANAPFTIAVGFVDEDHLADWHTNALMVGFLLAVVLLASLLFTLRTVRHLRQRAIEEQAKSEDLARRRILIDQSLDGIVVVDQHGKVWEANHRFAEMLGYSDEEVRQLHVWDWDTRWTRDELLQAIQTVDASGDHFETHHRRKDGSMFDVEISSNGAICSGTKLVFCVCRDISERKQATEALARSEEKWRHIVASTPMIGISLDPQARLVFANAHFLHLTGWREEEIIGHNWFDLFVPEGIREEMRTIFAHVMEQGETMEFSTHENVIVTRSGEIRNVAWFNTLNKDLGGTIIDITCLGVDLTERQRAEEEQKRLQAQLIQAQKLEAIGTLAGGIAHDFNNILAAIIGYTEMAMDALPRESPVVNDLTKVHAASHRAADLVRQILAFSRQSTVDRVPLQPAVILKEAVKLLRPGVPSTITIRQRIEGQHAILADPGQFHQVVMNLCTNAFHALEQTGGIITLGLEDRLLNREDLKGHPQAQPGPYVVLSVSDTGPGIPEDIKNRIFDPYFTTKEMGRGTGLGLAIVHGIATAAGGFVACDSEPGQGATFRVCFPAIEQSVSGEGQQEDSIPEGREHILFVDDETILVEMGKTMLERLGYRVTVYTSSLEALAAFEAHPEWFDAVITDQTMPGMTGMELARSMLRIRPDLPIILCTGYSNLVDEAQAKKYGIRSFAMKPLSKKDIASLLRSTLDARRTDFNPTQKPEVHQP